jgi:hypothetical protein
MNRAFDNWIAQKIKEEGRLWVMKQNFWLFGTALYRDGSLVNLQKASRNARKFFNRLDRQILKRKELNAGVRLPRLVFFESGRQRINGHMHFFIKGLHWQHYRQIVQHAEAIWTRVDEIKDENGENDERREFISGARDLRIGDNITANTDRAGYCFKEIRRGNWDCIVTECSHLPQ